MSGFVAENSIPAFEAAGLYGYWGCECDISETIDNKFVVLHDITVDRTTNGTGNINEMSYNDARMLSIDIGDQSICVNKKIPNLQEYLLVCKRFDMMPIMELKNILSADSVDRLIEEIEVHFTSYILSYSYIDLLIDIREKRPNIECQWLVISVPTNTQFDLCKQHGISISPRYNLLNNSTFMDRANSRNIKIAAWIISTISELFTINGISVNSLTTNNIVDYSYNKTMESIDLDGYYVDNINFNYSQVAKTDINNCFNIQLSTQQTQYIINEAIIDVKCRFEYNLIFDNRFVVTLISFDINGDKIGLNNNTPSNEWKSLPKNTKYAIVYIQRLDGGIITDTDKLECSDIKLRMYHKTQWV